MDSTANNDALHDQEMTVFLQVKKTLAMKVRGSAKIGSIKSSFFEMEGICEKNQELFINGDQLNDDQRLVDCGIREGNTLHLILQNNVKVKLLVEIPSKSRSIVIEARTYFSIGNIKYIISEKEGIEPNRYNLVYAGSVLEDSRTLSSLGMMNESVSVQLVFNPCDMISVSVITPTGSTVLLNTKVLYSVSDVKAIVGGMIGISVGDYGLVYKGKQLEESKSLACYDVEEGSVLQMSYLKFQIFVKPWSGKTITLDAQQCDTIELVKDEACKKLGIPNDLHSMLFGGKRLELQHDLAYYNIQKHATLHMVCSPSTVIRKWDMKLSNISSLALGVLNSRTTIHDLKAMIQGKFTSPVKEIYFRKRLLQDNLTIGHYKIGANDSVTIVSENVGEGPLKNVAINESLVK